MLKQSNVIMLEFYKLYKRNQIPRNRNRQMFAQICDYAQRSNPTNQRQISTHADMNVLTFAHNQK